MGKISLKLQTESLKEMALRKPFMKKLANIEYKVLPRVYKGSTDTDLFCSLLKVGKNYSVWDIGTGTGLIALTAKNLGAKYVLATDLNPDAIKNAKANSKLLKLKIDIRKVDMFGNINRKFDLITFNPPFTDNQAQTLHEISFWDKDHKTIKKFFGGIEKHIKNNGTALIAWSSFGKVSVLKKIAKNNNFKLIEVGRRVGKRKFIYYVFRLEKI
jgi:release factor glutamine methyltransferase